MIKVNVFGAKVRGEAHEALDLPCQDNFNYGSKDGLTIIAVSDGLGSASHSHIGSDIVTKTVVDYLLNNFHNTSLDIQAQIINSIEVAREHLKDEAIKLNINLRDLASTLLIALLADNTLYCAHIGDGGIVAYTNEEILLVSPPNHGEYVNEVTPVTHSRWLESINFSKPLPGVKSFCVFTDGCQGFSLEKNEHGYKPFEPFWRYLFDTVSSMEDRTNLNQELENLLLSDKIKQHSDDDKTFVIAIVESDK